MNYNATKEFNKDFKKLLKRFRTLKDDLDLFEKMLKISPIGNSKHFIILTKTNEYCLVKARCFCKSLKKNSLRIIYIYRKDCQEVEFIGIEFIELYFKGDKEREDKKRISKYLKDKKSP